MKNTSNNYREYLSELKRVWGDDNKMVEYCLKKASQVIKLPNGKMIEFSQPHIETGFCFGYSTCGQGPEYDEMNKTMSYVRKNIKDYFISENKRRSGYDELLKKLKDKSNNLYLGVHYRNGLNLVDYICCTPFDFEYRESFYSTGFKKSATEKDDKKAIINAIKEEKEKFEKRLETYWKRYGDSKLRIWSYWLDE